MPDPFLEEYDFEADYRSGQRTAAIYNASLSREETYVYLECRNQSGRILLARINCTGYPKNPPTFVFLHPTTKTPSANRTHWPSYPAPREVSGRLHICMRVPPLYVECCGTLVPRYSLSRLVEVLILLSIGQGHRLQGITGR